jgi:hypothetical protein
VHKEREVGGCTSTYAAGHAFTQSTAALLQQSREQCGSSSNRRTAHNCICGGASNDRIRMTTMSLWSVCGSQHRDPVPRCNIHSPHARMSPRYSPFSPHPRFYGSALWSGPWRDGPLSSVRKVHWPTLAVRAERAEPPGLEAGYILSGSSLNDPECS